jgi:hypothetical protein
MEKYKPDPKRIFFNKKEIKSIIKQAVEEADNGWDAIGWEGDGAYHGIEYLKNRLYKLFLLKGVSEY